MTNTEVLKTDSPSEGRRGLVYRAGDRWAWEPQIRAVQERTFAADGVPVEHHERQVAFHRAASEVDEFMAEDERRVAKGSPWAAGIPEHAIMTIALREARRVSGYRPRWFYITAATFTAVAVALTVFLLVKPTWVVQRIVEDMFLLDLPPGSKQLDVVNYGMWGVVLFGIAMLMAPLASLLLLGYELSTRRRLHKINELVLSAAFESARAFLVSAALLFVFVIGIVGITVEWPPL